MNRSPPNTGSSRPRAAGILLTAGGLVLGVTLTGLATRCTRPGDLTTQSPTRTMDDQTPTPDSPMTHPELSQATFGMGCFWCAEAVFSELDGVEQVQSGYAGGHLDDPTYEQVCSGATGHAEVIRLSFDATRISYAELLEVFWATHDPTTLNRQGNDVGTQYRSVIFCHDAQQLRQAELSRQAAQETGLYPGPIVTEILPAATFYPAEGYHQDYFTRNPEKPYCNLVIAPKIARFRKLFRDKLAVSSREDLR